MGVNICLEMAKRKTELVKSMILISGTVMPVNDVMFHTNIMEHLKPILHYGLSKYPKFYKQFWKLSGWNPLAKKLVHLGGFNTKEVPMEFIEIYLNRLGQLGPELFFHLLDEMSRHDIITHLSKITQPTLIVGGDNDKVIPNYLQKGLGQMILNSQIYIVKNGSHVPQVDFPELVNERMNYFLQTNLI
jgi:pimeloyl-ACP methyl ester carboxylesterase